MLPLILLFLVLSIPSLDSAGLVDNPIAGDFIQYFDKLSWKATNGQQTILASVPGDLLTDLVNAKLVPDLIYETNWLNSDIWDKHTWNYSVTFPSDMPPGQTELVFDGIKMGANIYFNDVMIGSASDQFLRYRFPVTLKASNNLVVSFPAQSQGIDCDGRFMACTGGWDWAPYSNTVDQHGSPTLTKGIWKNVYIVTYGSAAISHVVPQVNYLGKYPTTILTDTTHGGFEVKVGVVMSAISVGSQGVLSVVGSWGASQTANLNLAPGESTQTITLSAPTVGLWWPAGLGKQVLHQIEVSWVPKVGSEVKTTRQIGFRVFTLVTGNDTDPSTLQGKDGSADFTLRFKINGANFWSRGANVIPMEEFEGRANADAITRMVQSSLDANMNTLRVWGGGIFLYDAFYDACDKLGLVVYQDMMYAQNNHNPANTATQQEELIHQVSRLSHHPSIVLWDGCNECDGGGLYTSFVMTTVATVDKSRPIWPSCPSGGWVHGVDALWGLPNNIPLQSKSGSPFETHGPYQHGTGFKSVNDPSGNLELFDANIPPKIKNTKTGAEISGIYASEFGCSVMSSFESMSPTLSPDHWSLHAPPMSQRNYPCDNIIIVYWGNQDFSATGADAFKKQLYQCTIGAAIEMKSDIEVRRSTNEFGTIIWQLNEIWPTGGWGSLEYGSVYPGQVVGGRWKPLHYWYKDTLFTDIFASCDFHHDPVNCFIKNDGITSFTGKFTFSLVKFSDGKETVVSTSNVNLAPGAAVTSWFCAKPLSPGCDTYANILKAGECANSSSCIAVLTVQDSTGQVVTTNELALSTIQTWTLPSPTISLSVDNSGVITINSNEVAPYFTLTTLAQGRFSKNAFLLRAGTTTVTFIPFGNLDLNTLRTTLRYEHVKLYQ